MGNPQLGPAWEFSPNGAKLRIAPGGPSVYRNRNRTFASSEFLAQKDEQAAALILQCLREGKSVEIEGFGVFEPAENGGFEFKPVEAPRVFIAYAVEDAAAADALFTALQAAGMQPWMDRRSLKPGQNWPRLIESAIESSDFFVACLSSNSVSKRGGFQSEMRFAFDVARKHPLDDAFFLPVRLNHCRVPARISRELQYIDLFPDWQSGIEQLIASIRLHSQKRHKS